MTVDFGVPFSINFLSSSEFLGFRTALEQDAMSSRLVSFLDWKMSKHVLDLIQFWHNNFIRNAFFAYANFQRSQERHCYKLYIETNFSRNVFEVV